MKQVIGLVLLALALCGAGLAQNQTDSGGDRGSPSGRIVNGAAVSAESYPFVVGVYFFGRFFYGGSIITSKHVLTAAYGLDFVSDPALINVRAGNATKYNGIVFPVGEIHLHPEYNVETYENGVAILTITGTFDGYPNIAAIPLQTTEITYSSSNPTWCSVAGWGNTDNASQQASDILRLAWLQVISQYSCAKKWGSAANITMQRICAELPKTSACYGDYGGPLVCNGQLTGVVTLVDPLCAGTVPTVFTKVTAPSIRLFITATAGI